MQRAADVDVVFLCLPHAASIEPVRAFQATGTRVIDLSADFRLTSAAEYERWYNVPHTAPELMPRVRLWAVRGEPGARSWAHG